LGGTTYVFSSWSDGNNTATHNITAPAANTTYTATYGQQVATKPQNTTLPLISGPARTGRSVATSNGTWSGTTPMTFAYQWLQCDSNGNNCTAIAGATGASYVIRSADAGHRLRVTVTATNSAGSTPATSAATAVVRR
jgi:hypothetical protein